MPTPTPTKTQERAIAAGTEMAKKFFDLRSKVKDRRNVEVHVSEAELAALLALAFEKGYETRSRES